jgi:hypothetical protein
MIRRKKAITQRMPSDVILGSYSGGAICGAANGCPEDISREFKLADSSTSARRVTPAKIKARVRGVILFTKLIVSIKWSHLEISSPQQNCR